MPPVERSRRLALGVLVALAAVVVLLVALLVPFGTGSDGGGATTSTSVAPTETTGPRVAAEGPPGAPQIDDLGIDDVQLARPPCPTAPTVVSIAAVITDEPGVATARLRWRDAAGATGSRDMVAGRGDAYTERLGPFGTAGVVTWWIEATDRDGNTGRSADRTAVVADCA